MGFVDSGEFGSRIARITGELTEKLYSDYDAKLLGDKEKFENICRYSVNAYPSGCYSDTELEVQHRIKAKIKDLLETDYKHFEGFIPGNIWESAGDTEIIELLKFMLRLRIRPIDVGAFLRTDDTSSNELHRMNSQINIGKLNHNYEELCVCLLNRWNENRENVDQFTVEDVFLKKELIDELRITSQYMVNAIIGKDYEKIHRGIGNYEYLYEKVIEEIQVLEKYSVNQKEYGGVKPFLLKAVLLLEELMASNRAVISAMLNATEEDNKNKITESYLKTFRKAAKNCRNKLEDCYTLFEYYLLKITFCSLSNERKEWISIYEHMAGSNECEKKPVKNPKKKMEDVQHEIADVINWFGTHRMMPFLVDYKTLRNSVYQELYCYNKGDRGRLSRFGTDKFLEYINKGESLNADNMPYKELFYYEKILRGIYREQGQLEAYRTTRLCMSKIYAMEESLYSQSNISDRCLGEWAQAFGDTMLNTIIENCELFYKMPL